MLLADNKPIAWNTSLILHVKSVFVRDLSFFTEGWSGVQLPTNRKPVLLLLGNEIQMQEIAGELFHFNIRESGFG